MAMNDKLQSLLQVFVDKLARLTRADSCDIYLLDRPENKLVLRATKGPYEKLVGKANYHIGEGLTGRIAQVQETLFAHGQRLISEYPAWRGKYNRQNSPSAFLGIPILDGEVLLGVLKAEWYRDREISESVMQAVSSLAAELAVELRKHFANLEEPTTDERIYKADVVRLDLVAGVNQEVLEYLKRHPEAIHELNPLRFEELIAELLRKDGWTVDLTLPTRDGGFDILALRNVDGIDVQLLAQAKKYRPDRPVGVSAIRELYAVKLRRHATKALLATTSYVTAPAKKEFADVIPWEIQFKEFEDLVSWLSKSKGATGT
jgi:HJR/Mrr/RecB family endonuclease